MCRPRFAKMAMNPDTNEMEILSPSNDLNRKVFEDTIKGLTESMGAGLVRPNGEPVPEHWSRYTVGEEVVLRMSIGRAHDVSLDLGRGLRAAAGRGTTSSRCCAARAAARDRRYLTRAA